MTPPRPGGVFGEVAVTLRTAVFPLARLRPLPRSHPTPGRFPVVMLHGFMGHGDVLRPLARTLLRNGWGEVHRITYPSLRCSVEDIVARVEAVATPLAARFGQVDAVGHSLGAVAMRAWIKKFGGDTHVRRFVSLAGPHGGTSLYRLVPAKVRPALDPRGPWVHDLAIGPEPVPTTVIRSSWDQNVLPPIRAHIPGVREVIIRTHGHNGLLWSRLAHEAVMEALLRDEKPGNPVAEPVSP